MFEYTKLNDAGVREATHITQIFEETLSSLSAIVPEGRELSIVKTKLEEACFFAKKAISRQLFNQA